MDDEWMTMSELKKSLSRAQTLERVVERCQKLIARGETRYVNNDIKKAEEYFTKADGTLEDVKSDTDCVMDSKYQAQARARLGIARCWARGEQWSDAEEKFDEVLWTCDQCTNGEDEDILEIKALAMLGLAKVRDRIFEYEMSGDGGGEENYLESYDGRSWPDEEYESVANFLRPLVDKNPGRFEPVLLDVKTALSRWKRLNSDIKNNPYLLGGGDGHDPEDCRRKKIESFDLLAEVIATRRKLMAQCPEKQLVPLIEAINEMVENLSEGGGGFPKFYEEFVLCQLAALEPEVRTAASAAKDLAKKSRKRYSELRKRTEKILACVDKILSEGKRECLPDLLWRSPQFAEREIWTGTCVKTGRELPRQTFREEELGGPEEDWKLPLLMSAYPELMEKRELRDRFDALVEVDGAGHYVDSWDCMVFGAGASERLGTVNPWAFVLMFRPELARYGADFSKFNGYSACWLLARQPKFSKKWNLEELADEKSQFWKGSPHSDYLDAWRELVAMQPKFAEWRRSSEE